MNAEFIEAQEISCYVRIRPGRGKDKNLGSVHIQVSAQRNTDRVPLNIQWPIDKFDRVTGALLPRFKNDQQAYSYNLTIQNEMNKANRLRMQYYASGRSVTSKEFKAALCRFSSREDFMEYFSMKRDYQLQNGLISQSTWKAQGTTLARLREYLRGECLSFARINSHELEKFQVWLRKKKRLSHNSTVHSLKCFQTYINLAIENDSIPVNNPFDNFEIPGYVAGNRVALEEHEISALKNLYKSYKLNAYRQDVLRRYLISCYTGLRHSDLEMLNPHEHVANNRLRLEMIKTRNHGKKVEFPLSQFARELIGTKKGLLFSPIESAYINKTIKFVAAVAGIDKYVKFHSGRDTFATQYLRFGGNLADLKDILGHGSIRTTEIYLKMAFDSKINPINRFDEL